MNVNVRDEKAQLHWEMDLEVCLAQTLVAQAICLETSHVVMALANPVEVVRVGVDPNTLSEVGSEGRPTAPVEVEQVSYVAWERQ